MWYRSRMLLRSDRGLLWWLSKTLHSESTRGPSPWSVGPTNLRSEGIVSGVLESGVRRQGVRGGFGTHRLSVAIGTSPILVTGDSVLEERGVSTGVSLGHRKVLHPCPGNTETP